MKKKYPGVEDFIEEIGGYAAVDVLGKIDLIRAAFVAGRSYESLKSVEMLKNLPLTKQAE
jgi:hypothetical protein